ncbi:uncharacterized protein LOC143858988 [Tasmannia lanceolata]|uniref:uncharacterized protein LOC143858988 n=1 Tax=Tasmannia lanceolata TaxID=3420 RepID=UPI004062D6EA
MDYAVRFGFRASNNEAEYEALIAGMNLAAQVRALMLKAYSDSQLVVNQIQGTYEARDERMSKYFNRVHHLARKFKSFEIVRVPRTGNRKADTSNFRIFILKERVHGILEKASIETEVEEVMQVDHEPCWMDETIRYLREGKLPEDKKVARKVVQRSARFSLDRENLYKRSYTLPYLKCLRLADAAYTLQETHKGICGEHLGGKAFTGPL